MNCQEARKSLYTYLDGQLAATREQALYQHLSLCSGCQRELTRAREINRLLEDVLQPVDPPAGLVAAVLQRLDAVPGGPAVSGKPVCPARARATRRLFPREARGWLVAGVLAMLLGAGSLYLNQDSKTPATPPRVAEREEAAPVAEQERHQPGVGVSLEEPLTVAGEGGKTVPGGREGTAAPGKPATGGLVEAEANSAEPAAGGGSGGAAGSEAGGGQAPTQPAEVPLGRIQIAGGPVSQGVHLSELVVDAGDNMNPAWAAGGKKVYFLSRRPGSQAYQVWQVEADGRRAEPLPGAESLRVDQGSGAWRPDGELLAYVTERENRLEIWAAGPSGSAGSLTPPDEDAPATTGNGPSFWAYWPAWSSRGELAYLTTRYGGGSDLMLRDAGGKTQALTRTAGAQELYPAWSPDGEKLAFYRTEKGSAGERVDRIVILDRTSGEERNLTPPMGGDVLVPAWSPDGSRLAVNVGVTEPRPGVAIRKPGLWVINADGSGLKVLANQGGGALVSWSPDGRQVAFTDAAGVLLVVRLPAGGSQPEVLRVTSTGGVQNAIWSSDSRQLIFDWAREGRRGIWVASLPEQFNP